MNQLLRLCPYGPPEVDILINPSADSLFCIFLYNHPRTFHRHFALKSSSHYHISSHSPNEYTELLLRCQILNSVLQEHPNGGGVVGTQPTERDKTDQHHWFNCSRELWQGAEWLIAKWIILTIDALRLQKRKAEVDREFTEHAGTEEECGAWESFNHWWCTRQADEELGKALHTPYSTGNGQASLETNRKGNLYFFKLDIKHH